MVRRVSSRPSSYPQFTDLVLLSRRRLCYRCCFVLNWLWASVTRAQRLAVVSVSRWAYALVSFPESAAPRECLAVGRVGFEPGKASDGEGGCDGVPIRGVPGLAGFGIGAEELVWVIAGDLVLVAVGGDDAEVVYPLLA
jgi:hypothetical protein